MTIGHFDYKVPFSIVDVGLKLLGIESFLFETKKKMIRVNASAKLCHSFQIPINNLI